MALVQSALVNHVADKALLTIAFWVTGFLSANCIVLGRFSTLGQMNQYRVTKYNPQLRDSSGAFMGDNWNSICDIGSSFNGIVLTTAEYLRVENAYISSALAFLATAHVTSLAIAGLENHSGFQTLGMQLTNGQSYDPISCADIVRFNLRSQIWCRLESASAFLHFGYDYYMYIGVSAECSEAIKHATDSGLFVEMIESPYHQE